MNTRKVIQKVWSGILAFALVILLVTPMLSLRASASGELIPGETEPDVPPAVSDNAESDVTPDTYSVFAEASSITYSFAGASPASYAATVTGYSGDKPEGQLVIPRTIEHNSIMYPVTTIATGVFMDCIALTSVELPDTLTSIGYNAFEGCKALESINLPEGLNYIWDYAFRGCEALREVILPASITYLQGSVFYDCKSLETVVIPSDIGITTLSSALFWGCYSLTTLHIPENVGSIGSNALPSGENSQMVSVTVAPGNSTYTAVDGVLFNKAMTNLVFYPANKADKIYTVPSTATGIIVGYPGISDLAFVGTRNLETLCMTKKTYASINMYMFPKATSLKALVILDEETGEEQTLFLAKNEVLLLDETYFAKITGGEDFLYFNTAMVYAHPDGSKSAVYCIEPGVPFGSSETFGVIVSSLDGVVEILGSTHNNLAEKYSAETLRLIAICARLAGVNPADRDASGCLSTVQSMRYMAAQQVIYEIVSGSWDAANFDDIAYNSAWSAWYAHNYDYDYYYLGYDVIWELIYALREEAAKTIIIHSIPSFTLPIEEEAPEYVLLYDTASKTYTLTLTDSNSVLENFRVVESTVPDGMTAVINGNELCLSSAHPLPDAVNIRLEPKENVTFGCEIQVLYHPTQQIRIIGDPPYITLVHLELTSADDPDTDIPVVVIPEEEPPPDTFISDHVAYIIGYPEGDVRPGRNITRAEVATVFFRLITDKLRADNWTQSNPYPDVELGEWFNNAISVMNRMEIVRGYPDGTFGPDLPITRAEMAAMAARFAREMQMEPLNAQSFSDIDGHWAQEDILYAAAVGWVRGYPDGTFGPDRHMTRAEFMTLVNRMLEREPELPDDLLYDEMIRWPDNSDQDAWYYLAVQEATNSHIPEYKGKPVPLLQFNYEYWIEMAENRDWVQFEKQWSTANSA